MSDECRNLKFTELNRNTSNVRSGNNNNNKIAATTFKYAVYRLAE